MCSFSFLRPSFQPLHSLWNTDKNNTHTHHTTEDRPSQRVIFDLSPGTAAATATAATTTTLTGYPLLLTSSLCHSHVILFRILSIHPSAPLCPRHNVIFKFAERRWAEYVVASLNHHIVSFIHLLFHLFIHFILSSPPRKTRILIPSLVFVEPAILDSRSAA